MALVATDWSINTDKTIRYIGAVHGTAGAGYVTVLEMHRWLQDKADDAASTLDDYMDITRDTPSDKSFDTIINLINGYTLDETYTSKASEYIYGGSIIQGGGTDIWDGIAVVANPGCYVDVIQNGARVTTDFWNSTPSGASYRGLNPDSTTGKSTQFMLKVRTAGADIDSKRVLFQTREWGKTYSEFKIPGTGRGVNVVPLTYSADLNNTTASGTVAAWTTITNVTAGYVQIDMDNNGTPESYYSQWNRDTYTIKQFYERMKYLTGRTNVTTIYGVPGELFRGITHSVTYTTQAGGNFTQGGASLTWGTGTTAGTGAILADIDGGTTGTLYIQLLTGVAPTGTITQGGVTATTGTVIETTVSTPFCGQSTGSAIVAAYGFAMEYTDVTKDDLFTAFDGIARNPPNNVSFTVSNLLSGYSVLVAPSTGSAIQFNQFTLNGALTGAAVTSVVVNEAIPADTPSSGTIRILRLNGQYTRHPYSAVNTSTKTFTITSADFSGVSTSSTSNAANGANTFISYIDGTASGATMGYNCVYSGTPRTLAVRARFGGTGPSYSDSIKTFQTFSASLGSSGGSQGIVQTSDA
jgi:hypothetical protein